MRKELVEGSWSCQLLMGRSTESELIKLLLLLVDMEGLISRALQHTLVLETVVELSSEQDYLWKIWSLFSSIRQVFTDPGVL